MQSIVIFGILVIMDTGSSNFWITDKKCEDEPFVCKAYNKDGKLPTNNNQLI